MRCFNQKEKQCEIASLSEFRGLNIINFVDIRPYQTPSFITCVLKIWRLGVLYIEKLGNIRTHRIQYPKNNKKHTAW